MNYSTRNGVTGMLHTPIQYSAAEARGSWGALSKSNPQKTPTSEHG